jgi:hypothetical protein
MAEWKDTLNLPKTGFPMKANLQATEPQMLARWDAIDLYRTLRARRRGAPVFILHDGPPYANGNVHLGTALNKVLKDIVVRSRSMMGFDAPYVPGWDCHGLPIELRLLKELGPKKQDMSVGDLRRACRAYAARFVDVQREQFKRLGVLGDWADPYLTMDHRYQAAIVRALGRFVEQGMVYQGKKPVTGASTATALAEAEVEYENHTSPRFMWSSRAPRAPPNWRRASLEAARCGASRPRRPDDSLELAPRHPDACKRALVDGRGSSPSRADQLSAELPPVRLSVAAAGVGVRAPPLPPPAYARLGRCAGDA